jgi:hypothetical protein
MEAYCNSLTIEVPTMSKITPKKHCSRSFVIRDDSPNRPAMVSQVKRHFMEWDTPNEAIVDIQ